MPNFKRIGGGSWKYGQKSDDLTWNDPISEEKGEHYQINHILDTIQSHDYAAYFSLDTSRLFLDILHPYLCQSNHAFYRSKGLVSGLDYVKTQKLPRFDGGLANIYPPCWKASCSQFLPTFPAPSCNTTSAFQVFSSREIVYK